MPPRFIYFDLGNVLLHFDHRIATRRIAELTGLEEPRVWSAIFESGLRERYERGELDERGFHAEFSRATGTASDPAAFDRAYDEIFKLNATLLPLVVQLEAAGYPLGVLSNTCAGHWRYATGGAYGILPAAFDAFALSYQVGAMKPDARIYRRAVELAGVGAHEILYVDDQSEHVGAAQTAGFDGIVYTSAPQLHAELLQRGVRCNY